MKKKSREEKLQELQHKDIKDNNWELEDGAAGSGDSPMNGQSPEKESPCQDDKGTTFTEKVPLSSGEGDKTAFPPELDAVDPDGKEAVYAAWQEVDPEIRNGNPVWKYSLHPDQVVFVFRDGKKVRVMRNSE